MTEEELKNTITEKVYEELLETFKYQQEYQKQLLPNYEEIYRFSLDSYIALKSNDVVELNTIISTTADKYFCGKYTCNAIIFLEERIGYFPSTLADLSFKIECELMGVTVVNEL